MQTNKIKNYEAEGTITLVSEAADYSQSGSTINTIF